MAVLPLGSGHLCVKGSGLALSVFLADVVLPVGVVVGIPYVVVVVIASCFLRWGTVVGLALGCTGLTPYG